MARSFAGVLGYLGVAVVFARAAKAGAGLDGTLLQAVVAMAALAAVGAVVGAIAQVTVDEAVRNRLEKELADIEAAERQPGGAA